MNLAVVDALTAAIAEPSRPVRWFTIERARRNARVVRYQANDIADPIASGTTLCTPEAADILTAALRRNGYREHQ